MSKSPIKTVTFANDCATYSEPHDDQNKKPQQEDDQSPPLIPPPTSDAIVPKKKKIKKRKREQEQNKHDPINHIQEGNESNGNDTKLKRQPTRTWTRQEEINLLQTMLRLQVKTVDSTNIDNFIVHLEKYMDMTNLSKSQIIYKVVSLKKKYKKNAAKDMASLTDKHEVDVFNSCGKIWGNCSNDDYNEEEEKLKKEDEYEKWYCIRCKEDSIGMFSEWEISGSDYMKNKKLAQLLAEYQKAELEALQKKILVILEMIEEKLRYLQP